MSEEPSLDELKSIFAAADRAIKAPATTSSAKDVSQGKQKETPPKTFPREELPPLSVPLAKNTFTPLYRLGWQYTLREFVERIMKTHTSRTTAFEINVQKPFLAKYPHLPLPAFTLNGTSRSVIVYIATNVHELSRVRGLKRQLVDAAKDILGQNEDPVWHINV
ncbi:hypothetical protein BD413DRAFT_565809 [Trametes elegans]|nr:hypothetical protein BD413DRAFT_565809 [Trametes elegans]